MSRPDEGEVFFAVDARHIRQLGQELVGDRITAVAELIKNAYDADATAVIAQFSGFGEERRLTIEDDGHGMGLADLRRGWMRISTPDKDNSPLSPTYSRTRAGRKGIGRFATETLGSTLQMRSTVAGKAEAIVVDFDWAAFNSGVDLGTVGSSYRTEFADAETHGTSLEIRGLHHRWTDDDISSVQEALRLLQPPFPVREVERPAGVDSVDPGFEVRFAIAARSGESEGPSGYDDFIDAATALVTLVVDDGAALVHVASERLDLDDTFELAAPHGVGAFDMTAAYFVYRSDALGSIKTRTAQKMGREYGGIRLYRDGLRVMPYGETGVDWLGLEELQGSRSGILVPIRNTNWFGQVVIGRDSNPELIDTASREGLVQNEAYDGLCRVLTEALVKSAERVAAARGRKARTNTPPKPPVSRSDLISEAKESAVRELAAALGPDVARRAASALDRALDPKQAEAEIADAVEDRRLAALAGEVDLLRVLASLGTSIAVFNHEVQAVLNVATGAYAALRGDLAGQKLSPETREKLDSASYGFGRLQDLTSYINAYTSSSACREREPQALASRVEDFVDYLSGSLARGVDIVHSVQPIALRTAPMTRSELDTVLINFLTNSIKAMNPEGQGERRISISAHAREAMVVLRFQDTGVGIDPSISGSVFDAFVSDSRSAVNALGIGTGLGLKIVSDIAEAYGGSVTLGEPDPRFATCFEFSVPRWAKQI